MLERFTMFRDEAPFREPVVRHSRLVMGAQRELILIGARAISLRYANWQ
jgi:hypothetical protein